MPIKLTRRTAAAYLAASTTLPWSARAQDAGKADRKSVV